MRLWMARNPGGPGTMEKGCVVSIDAKEKMRLRMRENEEISGLLINVSYCGGSGGSGIMLLKYLPPLTQQKPARSPMRSSMLHIQHLFHRLLSDSFILRPVH